MGWEKDHILLLIRHYQKEPVLYCATHEDYRNRRKREAAWNRINEAVSKERPSTGVRDIRDKIENLRTVYALHKRKVENSIKKNGRAKAYVPTIWYYQHLTFLNDHLQPRSKKELNEKDQINGDDIDCDILHSNGYEILVKNFLKHKKGKNKSSEKKTYKPKKRKCESKHDLQDEEDKYDLFGAYVADRLRCIGTDSSHKLEDDILRLVMEAETKKYTTAKAIF